MQGIKIAVLRGGPSDEHDVSLRSGTSIIESLAGSDFVTQDIFIDKEGVWHDRGRPVDESTVLTSVDVVIPALHGAYGEDGKVQQMLERHGVPYTGADALSSALAMHKLRAKEILRSYSTDVLMARHALIEKEDDIDERMYELMRSFALPLIVKPVSSGSSVGVTLARDYQTVRNAVEDIVQTGSNALIEEYISGREATVGVIENFRNEELYVLPTIEIIPPERAEFFSLDAKYSGSTQEICPGNFSSKEVEELGRLASLAHKALGLRHYSRSDFIVTPDGIYYLETNTLPGMTSQSLFPKMLRAIGSSISEFMQHLIHLATKRV